MNTPYYLARHMGAEKKKLTGLIKLIAILSIALGIAVMIIATAVVTGFQQEIRNKVIGFGAHIQITNLDYNVSYEAQPITTDKNLISQIAQIPGVENVYPFITKPGIIKTDEEIHGVVFKGIDTGFEWDFFSDKIISGKIISLNDTVRSDEILISQYISKLLKLNTGDDVLVYFIQDPPRVRKFNISGIYDTGLEELDQIFILGDLKHAQRLNSWNADQVGGFGVVLKDFDELNKIHLSMLDMLPFDLNTRTVSEIYPQIFDWLALLDMNVYVIIIIVVLVAGINMITTLLISVLEKTNYIGIMKALGASNQQVRRIFLYHASFLILKGMVAGNILGIGLCFLQEYFGILKLSQESYFVNYVPIQFDILYILLINLGTFIICFTMLLLPSHIVSRISPVKAIRFR